MKKLSLIVAQYILDEEILEIAKRNNNTIRAYTNVPYELIYVDNSSPIGKEWLEQNCDVYIRCDKNWGNGEGWNIGWRKAIGDYICWMDNDVFLTKNWIKPLLKELEDPKIGIAFPLSQCKEDDTMKIRTVGFCITTRRDVVEKVGEFDYDTFGIANFEDDDYFMRTVKAGYILKLTQKSRIYHHSRATVDKIKEVSEVWNSNREKFLKKHNGESPMSYLKY